jgi:homospermidine synthase
VIGFGSVGQAAYKMLGVIVAKGLLPEISAIKYRAPEITEEKTDGIFSFAPGPVVTRETLVPLLDSMNLAKGDIVMELACRIDTKTIWTEVKKRGCHFLNSGFDVWHDVVLDLDLLEKMTQDPFFSKGSGSGLTNVFSFGCNPGIASHFVRHGLYVATGIADAREAAKAFGLKSVSFNERDTQWAIPGTEGEKTLISTQLDVLYNTWSPGNYIVETAESTVLYAGCPEEVKEISSAGPAVVAWVPTGPIIGFLAPHDETFTIQNWFDKLIPAAFVYEAPPTARHYIKGPRKQDSSVATCKLLTPAKYDIASPGYDCLGALLYSDKEGVAPFWCGIKMDVADALAIDPTGSVGPTPFQVTGGVWSALQFILQHPNEGDCFPEDVPTKFVMERAFPWAGKLEARPAPEALQVPGLFDPADVDVCLKKILAGEPKDGRVKVETNGVFAAEELPHSCAVSQLAFEPWSLLEVVKNGAIKFNHSVTPNAYVDRNRCVRTNRIVKSGEEVTLDHRLVAVGTDETKTLTKEYVAEVCKTQAVMFDEQLLAL